MNNPKRVAYWSIIGGFVNTAACARCLFVHEYLVGAWLGVLAVGMVFQYYVASLTAEALEASMPPPVSSSPLSDEELRQMCGEEAFEPLPLCTCGPERDAKDKECIKDGVPAMALWHCLDCGKVRPGSPIAPGGELNELLPPT
jgi:hypothetical protein